MQIVRVRMQTTVRYYAFPCYCFTSINMCLFCRWAETNVVERNESELTEETKRTFLMRSTHSGSGGLTGADRNPCFLYSLSRELVSKSIICPSVLQASGRFSQPQTVGKLLPGPLLRKASLFCSRGVRGSRKLIALSLLSRMKDSGKR